MKTLIRKLGNSAGAVIPAEALLSIGIKVGDSVEVEVINGAITLKPFPINHLSHVKPNLIELKKKLATEEGAVLQPVDIE
ncbi:MAG: hypothetical protein COB51_08960 [Moraxellaceae bacterium]|nr:MAG: hypothetical protein COB51_08960 [Moraxellaceae bacterium]